IRSLSSNRAPERSSCRIGIPLRVKQCAGNSLLYRGSNLSIRAGCSARKARSSRLPNLIGAAAGWGGLPRSAAIYQSGAVARNDGKTVYRLTVHNVPVDGFWSISVYNRAGYFEKNELDAYSLNDVTAVRSADGSVSVQFGGCSRDVANCLPIMSYWNYTV